MARIALPRILHRVYARLGGYFWAPCPLCGTYYGGHEWHEIDGKLCVIPHPDCPDNASRATGICPRCTRAGLGHRTPLVMPRTDREEETT